jgi:hypothetical protein
VIVWGVSLDDHEIGFQTRQLVSAVPVVLEQLATSNALASANVSLNGVA